MVIDGPWAAVIATGVAYLPAGAADVSADQTIFNGRPADPCHRCRRHRLHTGRGPVGGQRADHEARAVFGRDGGEAGPARGQCCPGQPGDLGSTASRARSSSSGKSCCRLSSRWPATASSASCWPSVWLGGPRALAGCWCSSHSCSPGGPCRSTGWSGRRRRRHAPPFIQVIETKDLYTRRPLRAGERGRLMLGQASMRLNENRQSAPSTPGCSHDVARSVSRPASSASPAGWTTRRRRDPVAPRSWWSN